MRRITKVSLLFVACAGVMLVSCRKAALPTEEREIAGAAPKILLAKEGTAQQPIVISPDAKEATRRSAEQLAAMLERITGAKFEVTSTPPPSGGIYVGTSKEFPQFASTEFQPEDSMRQDDYLLQTTGDAFALIGANEIGVSNAVWGFLGELGYRQYFPGAKWEVVPGRSSLEVAFNQFERPDYVTRYIWFGFGNWAENVPAFDDWKTKNRMPIGGYELHTGHAYDAIVSRFKEEFTQNPELLSSEKNGVNPKFNVRFPRTLELVAKAKLEEADKLIKAGKPLHSVSMDPSDGGGWGNEPEELAFGTPSDRTVLLANHVAKTLKPKYGDVGVGIYAYNLHAPAPSREKVHENVIVSFATAFIKGGKSLEENIAEWKEAGVTRFGVREYFGVYAWDKDFPGRSRAADLDYLLETIPNFHALGARFMSSESSASWGPNGLGFYLASKLLWDSQQKVSRDALIHEFVRDCFPEATGPMTQFYSEFIHPKKGRSLPASTDTYGRMFRLLKEARATTKDEQALARLDDLTLYTQYLALAFRYRNAKGAEQRAELEPLLKFGWRIRETQMIHSLALWRAEQGAHRASIPAELSWQNPPGKNPWKESTPFTSQEIAAILERGIEENEIFEFTPVAFSRNLVPVTLLPQFAGETKGKKLEQLFRGDIPIYTATQKPSALIRFEASAGMIYQNLGNATLSLYEAKEGAEGRIGDEGEETAIPLFEAPIESVQLEPNKKPENVEFKAKGAGGYIMRVSDRRAGTRIIWPEDQACTLEYSPLQSPHFHRSDMIFYVPKGTEVIAAYATGGGKIMGPDGAIRFELTGKDGYIKVPVGADAGKCWRFVGVAGEIQLLTVPPFMAPSVSQLLIPAEVVNADR